MGVGRSESGRCERFGLEDMLHCLSASVPFRGQNELGALEKKFKKSVLPVHDP